MKRIAFCLLWLFLVLPVHAQEYDYVAGAGGAAAACTTPTTGDTLNEGFEGVGGAGGYENTWSENVGSGSTVNEAATCSGTPPTGSCTKCINIVSTGNAASSSWDSGGSVDSDTVAVDIVFHIYVASHSISDWSEYSIIQWATTTGGGTFTGSLKLRKQTNTYLKAGGSVDSATVQISTGQWYTVKLHFDTTAASSYMQVDGGDQKAFTRNSADGRYLVLTTGTTMNYEIGYIYLDKP